MKLPFQETSTGATLRGDLFDALTSTVVALPKALAFGMASGLGPAAGLSTLDRARQMAADLLDG